MANAKAEELYNLGVSIWLDSLGREMIENGWLEDKLDSWGLRGQTSNPSIFQNAVSSGNAYDEAIADACKRGKDKVETCWEVMIADVQKACDFFRPMFDKTKGEDGYVSLELDPTKAHDTEGSLAQAHELWKRVDRKNLMIKVPATKEGLPVIEEALAAGYNVNVTLLFSENMYREVMERYLRALERRVEKGEDITNVASVASFFVSRVDAEIDKRLDELGSPEALALRGKCAVANSRVAYAAYQELIENSERFAKLKAKGARIQRPLWASTSTKNPEYPDTLYVDELIGPNCVNTLPEKTLAAALDHGTMKVTLTKENEADARKILSALASVGIDLAEVTDTTLLSEGVTKFEQAYLSLLETIDQALSQAKAGQA